MALLTERDIEVLEKKKKTKCLQTTWKTNSLTQLSRISLLYILFPKMIWKMQSK